LWVQGKALQNQTKSAILAHMGRSPPPFSVHHSVRPPLPDGGWGDGRGEGGFGRVPDCTGTPAPGGIGMFSVLENKVLLPSAVTLSTLLSGSLMSDLLRQSLP
jgi:hypothetical protein